MSAWRGERPARAYPAPGGPVQPRLTFPGRSGQLREYAGGVKACCDPLKIATHIPCGVFASRSRQSGKTNEAFAPVGADACRAASRRGGRRRFDPY